MADAINRLWHESPVTAARVLAALPFDLAVRAEWAAEQALRYVREELTVRRVRDMSDVIRQRSLAHPTASAPRRAYPDPHEAQATRSTMPRSCSANT